MTTANDNDSDKGQPSREQPCPICGRPASEEMRPFCSKRCADVDLHRWLVGRYIVPGEAVPTEGDPDE